MSRLHTLTDIEPRSQMNPEAHTPSAYHVSWKGGTEVEVGALLAGMLRGLQPRGVIETGSGDGSTTAQLALALFENGHGRGLSLELDASSARKARNAIAAANVATFSVVEADALTYPYEKWPTANLRHIDFAFFDGSNRRDDEFRRLRPYLSPVAVVAWHDTGNGLNTRGQVEKLHKAGEITAPLYLPTPRGLALARLP